MSFDWQKPTTQMLGRWQPWHDLGKAVHEISATKIRADMREKGEL